MGAETAVKELERLQEKLDEVQVHGASDHDILIELRVTQRAMLQTLAKVVDDHEARLRNIERRVQMAMGVIALVTVAASLILHLWGK